MSLYDLTPAAVIKTCANLAKFALLLLTIFLAHSMVYKFTASDLYYSGPRHGGGGRSNNIAGGHNYMILVCRSV